MGKALNGAKNPKKRAGTPLSPAGRGARPRPAPPACDAERERDVGSRLSLKSWREARTLMHRGPVRAKPSGDPVPAGGPQVPRSPLARPVSSPAWMPKYLAWRTATPAASTNSGWLHSLRVATTAKTLMWPWRKRDFSVCGVRNALLGSMRLCLPCWGSTRLKPQRKPIVARPLRTYRTASMMKRWPVGGAPKLRYCASTFQARSASSAVTRRNCS